MENPWANAWADSAKSPLPEPSPSWGAPSVSALHADHEDDLSTPSWPKEPHSEWGSTDSTSAIVWSNTDTSSEWNPLPSSFDKISLGKDSGTDSLGNLSLDLKDEGEPRPTLLQPATLSEDPLALTTSSISVSRISPPFDAKPSIETGDTWTTKSRTPSPAPNPPHISIPASEDPDGFGSFETGEDARNKDDWTPTKPAFPSVPSADISAWDSAWRQPPSADCGSTDEQEDAWELARREKEAQDRHVPPEFLTSILQQLETLSKDLWTDEPTTSKTGDDFHLNLEFDYSSFLQRLAPEDLVLPPKVPFKNTFTSKQLSEALKLTRNFSSTRSSPMAMYMASKGSTSWEASIKARPTIAPDDVTPAGWKIVETANDAESQADDEKRRSGGLFAFFGRRTASSASNTPNRISSPGTTKGENSTRSQISRSSSQPIIIQETNAPDSVTTLKTPPDTATIPTPDAQLPSFAPSPIDGTLHETHGEVPTPSVVSRFLGRISGRSTKPPPRDSLTLTSDDFEFLAEVPTANSNGDASGGILDMGILNAPVKPTPLPMALPPPLPPPPSRKLSPLPLPADERPSQPVIPGHDDLFSFLDTSGSNPVLPLRPSSVKPTKHASAAIPLYPPGNSTTLTDVVISTANGVARNAKSQPGALRPPLVAMKPTTAPPTTAGSNKLTPTPPISVLKPSTIPKGQSSTGIFPALNEPLIHQLSVPSNQIDEDDEFSDFLSSPPIPNPQFNSLSSSDFDELPMTTLTPPSQLPMNISNDNFGDFGAALTTLHPPPLPSKITQMSKSSSSNSNRDLLPSLSIQPNKNVKKADHARTLSLLESASSRGRWLSPPSPLPEALSPPPVSSISKSHSTGHLDHRGGGMQAQQAALLASLGSSSSSSAIAAGKKTPQNWQPAPPPSLNLLVPSSTVKTLVPVPARPQSLPREQKTTKSHRPNGGLSAQDLSFFEGL